MSGIIGHTMYAILAAKAAPQRRADLGGAHRAMEHALTQSNCSCCMIASLDSFQPEHILREQRITRTGNET